MYQHLPIFPAVLQLFRDAFSDTEHDFTSGSVRRAVLLLAIPMMLEMAMESVFAITDIFFVSALGADAVAAVGLTEAVMTVVYAVGVGLGMGVTALVARRTGERDGEGAAMVAGQTLWLGLLVALVVAGAGALHADSILAYMGASDAVIDIGSGYTAVMFGGSITIVYLFLLNAVFRGAGAPLIAMRALALANAINIALDPCLIFGVGPIPELGVTGAAVATTIGRGVGVLYLLWILYRGTPRIAIARRHLAWSFTLLARLISVSLGGILQFLVATASWVVLMRLISSYGSSATAGYTIAIRIIDFTILPAWGLSNAAATLVGQNLGARRPERARQSVWMVTRYNVVFMLGVAAVFLAFTEQLVGAFASDSAVVAYGSDCLRFVSYGYGFFAVSLVLTQAFNGAGDTYTPTWINFICFWLVQLPLAWWLADGLQMGPQGVFAAIMLAESLVAVLAYWQFQQGRWQHTTV